MCINSFPRICLFAEASSGCPIPDLRFSRPKKFGTTTTEQPYVTFETTQVYVAEDFTTADFEYEHGYDGEADDDDDEDDESSVERGGGGDVARQTRYTDFNPYSWGGEGDGAASAAVTKKPVAEEEHSVTGHHQPSRVERRKMRKHSSSGRRRLERPYQQHGHKQTKRDLSSSHASHSSLLSSTAPPTSSFLMHHDDDDDHVNRDDDHMHHQHITNIYYMQSTGMTSTMKFAAGDELAVRLVPKKTNKQLQSLPKRHRLQPPQGLEDTSASRGDTDHEADANQTKSAPRRRRRHARDGDRGGGGAGDDDVDRTVNNYAADLVANDHKHFANELAAGSVSAALRLMGDNDDAESGGSADGTTLRRVKRKSGKTTGALSRPKGASDSGSKSTSRKKDGECPKACWFEFNVCSCFPSVFPHPQYTHVNGNKFPK